MASNDDHNYQFAYTVTKKPRIPGPPLFFMVDACGREQTQQFTDPESICVISTKSEMWVLKHKWIFSNNVAQA